MAPGHSGDDGLVFLRPLRYVEPDPVSRPVGFRGLHVGNRHAAMDAGAADEFVAVLTVSDERLPATTHHHPLTDGEGNDWAAFAGAVDAARGLSRRNGPVLVNCKAGVSRSTSVLATAIAAESGRSLRASLASVQTARPQAVPHPALFELGVYYLAAAR